MYCVVALRWRMLCCIVVTRVEDVCVFVVTRMEDACYVVTVGWRMCVVLCYCEWSGECVFVSVLTVWSICCHCEWWMCEYVSIV